MAGAALTESTATEMLGHAGNAAHNSQYNAKASVLPTAKGPTFSSVGTKSQRRFQVRRRK